MSSMKMWMLGAAMVAGAASLGTTTAQAAEFGFHFRGPVAYVPPCPGPGYVWTNGYMANGYWVAGYWNLPVGYGVRFGGPGYGYGRGYDRGFDRGFGHGPDHGYGRGYIAERGGPGHFRR